MHSTCRSNQNSGISVSYGIAIDGTLVLGIRMLSATDIAESCCLSSTRSGTVLMVTEFGFLMAVLEHIQCQWSKTMKDTRCLHHIAEWLGQLV